MSKTYREVTGTVEVPKSTGVPGLLATIRRLIGLPRVQEIQIDGRRQPVKVSFMRYALEDEPEQTLEIELETLMPFAIVRNTEIRELIPCSEIASITIAQMFQAVSAAGLWPIAFISGPKNYFWRWHKESIGFPPSGSDDDAYGLPFLVDHKIEPETLLLTAGYTRTATLIDARHTYKITMPSSLVLPTTTVEVISQ